MKLADSLPNGRSGSATDGHLPGLAIACVLLGTLGWLSACSGRPEPAPGDPDAFPNRRPQYGVPGHFLGESDHYSSGAVVQLARKRWP
jgi:hypothetical protein